MPKVYVKRPAISMVTNASLFKQSLLHVPFLLAYFQDSHLGDLADDACSGLGIRPVVILLFASMYSQRVQRQP